jgi:predicted transcriptional regulator
MIKKSAVLVVLAITLIIGFSATNAFAIKVGDSISNVNMRDSNDKPKAFPDFGSKVLLVLYTDPDVADINDAFGDAVKAAKLDENKFRSVGVANMKDTWKPNSIIRMVVRSKEKKYGIIVLTDPSSILKNAWGLGNCDDTCATVLIGKDKKVYFYKKGKVSGAESQEAIKIMKELMAK